MRISLKFHMVESINWKETQFMLSSTGASPRDLSYAVKAGICNKSNCPWALTFVAIPESKMAKNVIDLLIFCPYLVNHMLIIEYSNPN